MNHDHLNVNIVNITTDVFLEKIITPESDLASKSQAADGDIHFTFIGNDRIRRQSKWDLPVGNDGNGFVDRLNHIWFQGQFRYICEISAFRDGGATSTSRHSHTGTRSGFRCHSTGQ